MPHSPSRPVGDEIAFAAPAAASTTLDDRLVARHTRRLTARLKTLARLAFTAAIVIVLLLQVNLVHVSRVLRHIHPLAALSACGLMFVVGAVAVVKWRVLLRGVGVAITLPLGIRLTAIAFLWNLILPGGESGTIIRTTMLARQRPGAGGMIWASVAVEHLTLVTAQLLVGGGALLLAHYPPPQLALWLAIIGVALLGFGSLFALLLAPLSTQRLDARMARASRALVIPQRLRRFAGRQHATPDAAPAGEWLAPLWQGLIRYRGQTQTLANALLLSMAYYAALYGAYWVAARGLGIHLGYFDIVWLIAFATLVTHLPITIAGVGVREGIVVFFLTQRHVHLPVALAFSLTILALNIIVSLPGLVAQALHTSEKTQACAAGRDHAEMPEKQAA